MDAFTITTGLASLFSFIIQIFDFFPRLGKARLIIATFLVGVFVGSLLRAIAPASIRLNVAMTGLTVLVGIFLLVLVGLLVTAVTTTDAQRRTELFVVTGLGLAACSSFSPLGPRSSVRPAIELSRCMSCGR